MVIENISGNFQIINQPTTRSNNQLMKFQWIWCTQGPSWWKDQWNEIYSALLWKCVFLFFLWPDGHSPSTMLQQQTLVCFCPACWRLTNLICPENNGLVFRSIQGKFDLAPLEFYYSSELGHRLFIRVFYLRLFFWRGTSFQQSSSCQKAPRGGLISTRRERRNHFHFNTEQFSSIIVILKARNRVWY